jgi:predicted Zn-ribbon and HTH transcriptional regulator
VRAKIAEAIRGASLTARQLSERVGASERDVAEHLVHVAKSAAHGGAVFVVEPARCRGCDYSFEDRARLTRPSRCPRCGGERIEPPAFTLRPSEPEAEPEAERDADGER